MFDLFRSKSARNLSYEATTVAGRVVTHVINGERVTNRLLVTNRVTIEQTGWVGMKSEIEHDGHVHEPADAQRAAHYTEPGRRITVEQGVYVLRRNWPSALDTMTRITGTAVSLGNGNWHVQIGDPHAIVNGMGKTFSPVNEAKALKLLWMHG
jgi:hypothetical protein